MMLLWTYGKQIDTVDIIKAMAESGTIFAIQHNGKTYRVSENRGGTGQSSGGQRGGAVDRTLTFEETDSDAQAGSKNKKAPKQNVKKNGEKFSYSCEKVSGGAEVHDTE